MWFTYTINICSILATHSGFAREAEGHIFFCRSTRPTPVKLHVGMILSDICSNYRHISANLRNMLMNYTLKHSPLYENPVVSVLIASDWQTDAARDYIMTSLCPRFSSRQLNEIPSIGYPLCPFLCPEWRVIQNFMTIIWAFKTCNPNRQRNSQTNFSTYNLSKDYYVAMCLPYIKEKGRKRKKEKGKEKSSHLLLTFFPIKEGSKRVSSRSSHTVI